jgi:predicted N-acetyltransferase YhbS
VVHGEESLARNFAFVTGRHRTITLNEQQLAADLSGETTALAKAVTIRDLKPSDDVAALTRLLNEAYQPLAEAGLRFFASYQNEKQTRERLAAGQALVAELKGQIVGTITLSGPDRKSHCLYYRRAGVFCLGQFAVGARWQGRGIGGALLQAAEERAKQLGAKEVALSTAETATKLLGWYERLGFRPVETVSWKTTNYRSVILAKPVCPK